MAQVYTFTNGGQNTVLNALALTTSPDTYTFTVGPNTLGIWTVQFYSDAAALYSHSTSGPFFPVPITQGFTLDFRATQICYFKAVTGTATLSAIVTEGRTGMFV